MNAEQQAPYILLTGHRKGGTTMFHSLFDGHDSLCSYPVDLTVLYAYFPHLVARETSDSALKERLEKVVFEPLKAKLKLHDLSLDLEQFKTIFRANIEGKDLRNLKQVIDAMTSSWRTLNGWDMSKPMILKETSVDIYAGEIFKWFPDIKIIQIVRDPRDNYAALKAGVGKHYSKLGESELSTLASMLNRAMIDMKMATMNTQIYGPEKYLVLRFEDLLTDTPNAMHQVSEFLNIPFDPCLLTPTFLGESTGGNNYDGKVMTAVSQTNLSRWKERITEQEAQIIEFTFRGVMEQFDYQPVFSEMEASQAFAEYYKWSNYHYFFHDPFAE